MVQRIKVTPELRDRAWRDFYSRHRRVLTLTEGQRRHIARVTERRERYSNVAVVAAVPVLNAANRPIAVLAGSSADPASRLDGPEGLQALLTHADALARVLVDLLGWETDA